MHRLILSALVLVVSSGLNGAISKNAAEIEEIIVNRKCSSNPNYPWLSYEQSDIDNFRRVLKKGITTNEAKHLLRNVALPRRQFEWKNLRSTTGTETIILCLKIESGEGRNEVIFDYVDNLVSEYERRDRLGKKDTWWDCFINFAGGGILRLVGFSLEENQGLDWSTPIRTIIKDYNIDLSIKDGRGKKAVDYLADYPKCQTRRLLLDLESKQ